MKAKEFECSRIKFNFGDSLHAFKNICNQKGITNKYTSPRIQQQNGVSIYVWEEAILAELCNEC